MQIVTIVGARPQFIKAAAVSGVLRQMAGVREWLVHTGQHYDENMSQIFFDELGIAEPDFRLGVGSLPHGAQTGRMMAALETILLDLRPDWVLVYGDTNSTLAGALSAAKLQIPVAHVEAGLRSFNRHMPEEINRLVTDRVSDLLLAPTPAAVAHLAREGIQGEHVQLVGDVMYDVALSCGERAEHESDVLHRLGLEAGDYILVTVHRAENTDDPARLGCIASALAQVAKRHAVVMPLHPRTRGALERSGLFNQAAGAMRLIEPVGYLDMVMLERHARLIATDSGGVQKEAFFHATPCVTLRDETEWIELVELGFNRLAPPRSVAHVVEQIEAALASPPPSRPEDLYGGGQAGRRIASLLVDQH